MCVLSIFNMPQRSFLTLEEAGWLLGVGAVEKRFLRRGPSYTHGACHKKTNCNPNDDIMSTPLKMGCPVHTDQNHGNGKQA